MEPLDKDKPVNEVKDSVALQSERERSYSDEVGHLSAAYENAQRTIRFMDAKVSAVLAFVTSIVAVSGLIVKWVLGLVSSEIDQFSSFVPANGVQITSLISFLVFGFFVWTISMAVFRSFQCLVPRGPTCEPTVLFPFWDGAESPDKLAVEESLIRFVISPEAQLAREEYGIQIRMVGEISRNKMVATKKAVENLRLVLLSALLLGLSALLVFAATEGLFG